MKWLNLLAGFCASWKNGGCVSEYRYGYPASRGPSSRWSKSSTNLASLKSSCAIKLHISLALPGWPSFSLFEAYRKRDRISYWPWKGKWPFLEQGSQVIEYWHQTITLVTHHCSSQHCKLQIGIWALHPKVISPPVTSCQPIVSSLHNGSHFAPYKSYFTSRYKQS